MKFTRQYKMFLAVIVIFTLAFTFTACGGNKDNNTSNQASTTKAQATVTSDAGTEAASETETKATTAPEPEETVTPEASTEPTPSPKASEPEKSTQSDSTESKAEQKDTAKPAEKTTQKTDTKPAVNNTDNRGTFTEDFESGKLNSFTNKGGFETEYLKITSDPKEVISGKYSMIGKGKEEGYSMFAISIPEKCKIPTNSNIILSFDYRIVEEPGVSFYENLRLPSTIVSAAVNYGFNTWGGEAGTTGKFSKKIFTGPESDIVLCIGANTGGTIVIDNIKIEKTK